MSLYFDINQKENLMMNEGLQLLQALQGSGLDGVGDDGGFKSGYCIQNNC